MKLKMYFISLLVILTGILSFSFKAHTYHNGTTATAANYPSGASANLGAGYTGASWDNSGRTCAQSGCHSGGAYNPTTTITLLSGTTPVTSYIPGTAYTFNIKITAASGSPKYAFNATCATTAAHLNINKWGTMPTGSKNTTVSSSARNYIEQTSARTATGTSPTSYYSINVPWTAPVAGTGSVTFYAEGMAVNGTGGTGGDSPAPSVNLTISEGAPLPVSISSVTAGGTSESVQVRWTTEQEINTSSYHIEHSTDGIHFTSVGSIAAAATSGAGHSYEYTHSNVGSGRHFYRILELDRDGAKTYSEIVAVNLSSKKAMVISPDPVGAFINLPQDEFNGSYYIISSVTGIKAGSGKIQQNRINTANLVNGVYFLSVIDQAGNVQTSKFMKR